MTLYLFTLTFYSNNFIEHSCSSQYVRAMYFRYDCSLQVRHSLQVRLLTTGTAFTSGTTAHYRYGIHFRYDCSLKVRHSHQVRLLTLLVPSNDASDVNNGHHTQCVVHGHLSRQAVRQAWSSSVLQPQTSLELFRNRGAVQSAKEKRGGG